MEDIVVRFFANLAGRLSGPMNFRLILQPLVALTFAARAGLHDAKVGRPLYFWGLLRHNSRRELLKEGWKDVGRIFVVAVVLDALYQIITVRWIYPGEALLVAAILAFVPYVVFRGAFARIGRLTGMGPPA